ncbi:hypothetical protein [Mesorhizobium sp. WSM2239]|uniref:Uncharacterized protein n=2 Tax=unclassified Mesorhizobium TaxID=325217 RepID=A0AAU8DEL0_9HYPH
MNIKNLVRLRDAMLADTNTTFNMVNVLPERDGDKVGDITDCGTVACIAGLAVIHFITEMDPKLHPWDAAEKWLGLTKEEGYRLFGGQWAAMDKSMHQITKDEALAEINRLIHKYWFDRAYNGLAGQEWQQSKKWSGQCMYLDPNNGRRCAVGHMIDPELYDPDMDGDSDGGVWGWVSFTHQDLLPGLTLDQFNRIQKMHDSNVTPDNMQAEFDAYRTEHNLT